MRGGTPPDAAEARRALPGILGLSTRAGGAVHGTDAVRRAAREGKLGCVLLAGDGSPTQRAKLVPLLEAREIPFFICLTRDDLGAATGRGPVSAVGLTEPGLARRAAELAAALEAPRD